LLWKQMPDPANSSSLIALFRVVIQIPPKLSTPATSSLFASIGARTRHRKLVAVEHEVEEEVHGLDVATLAVCLDGSLLAAAPRPAAIAERFPSVGPAGGGTHVTVARRYRLGVTRVGKDCRERAGVPR